MKEIVAFIERYVVLPSEASSTTLALWVIHTHALAAAEATPYMFIVSPEKRSGKSRLLEVLELLVRESWFVAGVSEAVLFRRIEAVTPTLLLDEVDAVFGTQFDRTEPLRAILNAGNRRGAKVSRCVGPLHEVVDFGVFSAKALAGIATTRFPATVLDRSVKVLMHRKADEPVDRFRYRVAKREAEEVQDQIRAWVKAHLEPLTEAEPELPDELDDRAAEGWGPLLAIADELDDELGRKARAAALALSAEVEVEDESVGVRLLRDIRELFVADESEKMFSKDICEGLRELDEAPWRNWGRDRQVSGINPRDLATWLRPFGIRSKQIRQGSQTGKGYRREQLGDAWRRYLPPIGEVEAE